MYSTVYCYLVGIIAEDNDTLEQLGRCDSVAQRYVRTMGEVFPFCQSNQTSREIKINELVLRPLSKGTPSYGTDCVCLGF